MLQEMVVSSWYEQVCCGAILSIFFLWLFSEKGLCPTA
jgi:hypothetical protein